jgi:hypothetical protein
MDDYRTEAVAVSTFVLKDRVRELSLISGEERFVFQRFSLLIDFASRPIMRI